MKNLLIILLIAGAVATASKPAKAQDTLLYRYMQTAAVSNPGLQAKFKAYYAALQEIPQVGALPDPNAVLGYYVLPVETKVGSGVANIQLSQSFPWFGTLAAKKDEASRWAAAKFQGFQNAKNNLFYELKTKYYQLYFVHKSMESRRNYLEILRKDEKVTLAKVSGGRTSLADALRVQMAVKENETQLILLRDKWQSLSADFNQLLARPSQDSVEVTDSLHYLSLNPSEAALLDSMIRKNPQLNQLREQDTAYQSGERVAHKAGLPSVGVGLNYSLISAYSNMSVAKNGQDILMPMVSLSLPLYRSKYKAKLEEARLMRQSNQLQMQDMENTLSAALVNALNQYKDAGNKANLYRQLMIQAGQTYQVLMAAYSANKETYVEVLRIEEKLLDYRLNLQQAVADQYTALALLNKLTAHELQ